MSKHTPEPWTWRDAVGAGIQISGVLPAGFKFDATDRGADGTTSFMLFTLREPYTIQFGDARWVQFKTAPWTAMQEANADRIVACVNALAGIDDPASYLESLRLTSRTDAERIKALEHDRATMWAECEAWRSGGIYMTFNGPQGPATELAAATDALPWVRERGTQSW